MKINNDQTEHSIRSNAPAGGSLRRIRLLVAYDGTDYCGFQWQNNGPTIEDVLKTALEDLLKEPVRLISASRTDAGVHSLGNVVVFDTASRIPADRFAYAINRGLPPDIAIQASDEVPLTWHPRKQVSKKTYEYRILNRKMPDPTKRRDHYFYHYPLDETRMKQAAEYLAGTHDFASFVSAGSTAETTVRTIHSIDVFRKGEIITIRVCGNGFLYNMIRIIAGTLILIGSGQMEPEQMQTILSAKDRSSAGPTAPACGLTMIGITYEKEN